MPLQLPAVPHASVAPPQITGTTNEVMAQALLYHHALVSNYGMPSIAHCEERICSLVLDRPKNSVVVISAGYGAADAAQVAEANRYKLDVEREVHPDGR
jgi:hypothetical protein